jgi:hypothetical protein
VRIPQSGEEEQETLLVIARSFELFELPLIESERRHDDRGVRLLLVSGKRAPELVQAGARACRTGALSLGGEVAGERRLGDHAGSLLPTGQFGSNPDREMLRSDV